MKFKNLLRPSLAIVFAFIGVVIAKVTAPLGVLGTVSDNVLISVIAACGFGILGFILPELLTLIGKAGVAALAAQIVRHIPAGGGWPISALPFRRKRPRKMDKYFNPLVIDTSALIDGRLVEVAKCGFLVGTLLVIPSVINELHKLADSANDSRRLRGRRGLDMLAMIQKEKKVKVEILKSESDEAEVDHKLVKLARNLRGKIITVDFNLNKVAKIYGVPILNVNELANAVKTEVLPYERLRIRINAVGREKDQGVGYLADGTMVVVENGAKLVGKTMDIMVLKVLQTAAGKMVFGKIS